MSYISLENLFSLCDDKEKLINLSLTSVERQELIEKLSKFKPKYYSKFAFRKVSGLSQRIIDILFNSPTFPIEVRPNTKFPVIEEWKAISYFSIQRNWYSIQNMPCEVRPYPTNYALISKVQDDEYLWTLHDLFLLYRATNPSFGLIKATDVATLLHIKQQAATAILKRSDAPTLKIGGSIYIEANALYNYIKEKSYEKNIL